MKLFRELFTSLEITQKRSSAVAKVNLSLKGFTTIIFIAIIYSSCFASGGVLQHETAWQKFKTEFNKIDNEIFLMINKSIKSNCCDYFMLTMTMLGNILVIVPIAGMILFLHNRDSFKYKFLFLVTILLVGGIIVQLLKYIFNRPRPAGRLTDIKILVGPFKAHGFPSGHTQTIFTVALFLSKEIKRYLALFILIAIIVGISRIYVGVHFLSDIIGGAIIGITVTETSCWLLRKKPQTFLFRKWFSKVERRSG
ncbi:MAG: phosphatase PAP2 family protein [Elusimicrobiota bacterium]|nr:phosphatase PAP2 family protein [Elusimicrobiota bacterium]